MKNLFLAMLLVISIGLYADGVQPVGFGTSNYPYQIENLDNLLWVSTNSSSWDAHFNQTADIDATSTSGWNSGAGFSPIGNLNTNFTGCYDGQGFVIHNLHINRSESNYQALFGYTNGAAIMNLGLTSVYASGYSCVGGIVGGANSSSISSCFSTGFFTADNFDLGGLIGTAYNSKVTLCYSSGNVYGNLYTGGLIGGTDDESVIDLCYSLGSVSANEHVGGLIGNNGAIVKNSYSKCSVSGYSSKGGLVGTNYWGGSIEKCYSTGSVSGGSNSGGLVGYDYPDATCTNSFWDRNTSNQNSSVGGIGKTTAEMHTQSTFTNAGWDFINETTNGINDYWEINNTNNGQYPFLSWSGYIFDIYSPAGSGTEADPYRISTLSELRWVSREKSLWNSYFIQTADINAVGTQNWNGGDGFSPIGIHGSDYFSGDYDGQGHIIDYLSIDRSDENYQALFGHTDSNADISNLGVTNISITGSNFVGGVVGRLESSTITNCFSTGNIYGSSYAGGLIGFAYSVSTENCFSSVGVSAVGSVGGLVGAVWESSTFTNCYSTGSISGSINTGGLVGENNSGIISNCFWDTESSLQNTSGGGTGKITLELQSLITFINSEWDFIDETTNGNENIWGISSSDNNGYPFFMWQGFSNQIPFGFPVGNGTAEHPFEIEMIDNLEWLSSESLGWKMNFIQTADIDASDTQNWNSGEGFIPIGIDGTTYFSGNYNGQDYKIDGLFINRSASHQQSLFGYTYQAVISNLGVTNVNITGSSRTSGLVGWNKESTITNCYTSGSITGNWTTAGLVGRNEYSYISFCYSSANIDAHGNHNGGLVGANDYDSSIINCYSTGDIIGYDENIGGLVGENEHNSEVNNCYSISNVSGGTGYVGGLIGKTLDTSSANNSFWDIETSGQSTSAAGIGKTTLEMQNESTFTDAGWDFMDESTNGTDDIWGINLVDNDFYLFLSWQGYYHNDNPPEGSGTEFDPYQISTINELRWLSEFSGYWNAYFIQTADIDASSTISWNGGVGFSPIGTNNSKPFSGNYDGNGYSIDGLNIHRTSMISALFGYACYAVISNLGVTNVDVSGTSQTAGLVGFNTDSKITNCYTSGSISGEWTTGGLIGRNDTGTISNCYSTADITAEGSRNGGLIGANDQESTVTNCYAKGTITCNEGSTGGLVGENNHTSTINNCFSKCHVSGGASNIGGLVGYNLNDAVTTNSFWDTETSGQSTSAGGTGKTTSEMQTQSTFIDAGWDFALETANGADDIWGMNGNDNNGYPFLIWQGYDVQIDTPQTVTIQIVGNNIQINWDSVTGANSYKIFASDSPDGIFVDVTNSGSFGRSEFTTRRHSESNRKIIKKNNSHFDKQNSKNRNRDVLTWTVPISDSKKFYYVKASTD